MTWSSGQNFVSSRVIQPFTILVFSVLNSHIIRLIFPDIFILFKIIFPLFGSLPWAWQSQWFYPFKMCSRSLTSLHSQNSFQHVSQNLPPPAPSYSPPTSSHDFRDITPTSSTESNPSLKGDRCPYYQFIIIWIYDISQKYMYSDRTC